MHKHQYGKRTYEQLVSCRTACQTSIPPKLGSLRTPAFGLVDFGTQLQSVDFPSEQAASAADQLSADAMFSLQIFSPNFPFNNRTPDDEMLFCVTCSSCTASGDAADGTVPVAVGATSAKKGEARCHGCSSRRQSSLATAT